MYKQVAPLSCEAGTQGAPSPSVHGQATASPRGEHRACTALRALPERTGPQAAPGKHWLQRGTAGRRDCLFFTQFCNWAASWGLWYNFCVSSNTSLVMYSTKCQEIYGIGLATAASLLSLNNSSFWLILMILMMIIIVLPPLAARSTACDGSSGPASDSSPKRNRHNKSHSL